MGKKVEVVSVNAGNKIECFYRIYNDGCIESAYELTLVEYSKVNKFLSNKGYKGHLIKLMNVPSYGFAYYDVDEDTIDELTKKFGKYIPKEEPKEITVNLTHWVGDD